METPGEGLDPNPPWGRFSSFFMMFFGFLKKHGKIDFFQGFIGRRKGNLGFHPFFPGKRNYLKKFMSPPHSSPFFVASEAQKMYWDPAWRAISIPETPLHFFTCLNELSVRFRRWGESLFSSWDYNRWVEMVLNSTNTTIHIEYGGHKAPSRSVE